MKRLLLVAVLVCLLLASPVMAIRSNFQNFDPTGYAGYFGTPAPYVDFDGFVSPNNNLILYGGASTSSYVGNTVAATFTYLAFDEITSGMTAVALYDSTHTSLETIMYTPGGAGGHWHRIEILIVGGTPMLYDNGVWKVNGALLGINPSYFTIYRDGGGFSVSTFADNIVYGESDHHVIGALPVNWSILRDFSGTSTGTYAWNPNTNVWVLKNSYNFYVDADVDSQDGIDTETLQIANMATGVVVNSTVIDSTIPYHRIAYNVTAFSLLPSVLDGQYSVGYSGSTVKDYFWVISTGGRISMDHTTYNIGDTGTLSWYLSAPDTTNWAYTYQFVDVYGNTKASGPTATSDTDTSGTKPITFSSGTFSQGVLYAEMIATGKAGTPYSGQVKYLAYEALTINDYLGFYGHVYDGNSTALLSGAKVNFTQLGTSQIQTTAADGNYSLTGLNTGGLVTINVSKSGYRTYNYNFTPLATGNKSLDLAIYPTAPLESGSAIGGIARDTTYGNLIAGATVYVWNASTYEFKTTTTNSRGGYLCDNGALCYLTSSRVYDVQGNKTGYTASPVYPVVAP
jgi:hypothetical protein